MSSFSDYTENDLNREASVTLTVAEMRALQLVSQGDTFADGSVLGVSLDRAAGKIGKALDLQRSAIAAGRFGKVAGHRPSPTDEQIRAIFLTAGFKMKDQGGGRLDLNGYVYTAARALLNDPALAPLSPD